MKLETLSVYAYRVPKVTAFYHQKRKMPPKTIERQLLLWYDDKTPLLHLNNNGCIVITCFLLADGTILLRHLLYVFGALQGVE